MVCTPAAVHNHTTQEVAQSWSSAIAEVAICMLMVAWMEGSPLQVCQLRGISGEEWSEVEHLIKVNLHKSRAMNAFDVSAHRQIKAYITEHFSLGQEEK